MVTIGVLAALTLVSSAPFHEPVAPLDRLKAGNLRFVHGKSIHPNQDRSRMLEVAQGQRPFAIVLTCADSRLSPEIIFDQGLGDLFVIRVAGNVADPYVLASVEYAAEHLGSNLLVVLGHEKCGAVKAALDASQAHNSAAPHGRSGRSKGARGHAEGHVDELVAEILPAVAAAKSKPGDVFRNAVEANVSRTVGKTVGGEPLASMVGSGQLTVIGAVYDVSTGLVRTVSVSRPKAGLSYVRVHKD